MLTGYSQNHWAIPENTKANVRLLGGWGQGTLELIKVGRFVIQAGLKSTGQESKCLGAQLQLPGEGCRVGERGRIDGEVRTCTQEPAKLHNETS